MKSTLLSLALASICGITCYLVAGNSLDLFIGGIFFAALLAGQLPGDWGTVVGITLGLGFCWWMPVHAQAITARQWAMCVTLLFSFVAMITMAVRALRQFFPRLAPAIVTLAAVAWLSWPIWLAGSIAGSSPYNSILFHPLFATNHVVSDLGIWTEQQAAYSLTNLGQDVPYQLPFSAWPAIAMQAAIVGLLATLIKWMNYKQSVKNTLHA